MANVAKRVRFPYALSKKLRQMSHGEQPREDGKPLRCVARRGAVLLVAAAIFTSAAQAGDELPKTDSSESFDVEPPLLIQPGAPTRTTAAIEPERIAAAIDRARKGAAGGERLYKAGIISKVEMEQRVLKIVRLECDLSNANFERAKQDLAAKQIGVDSGEIATEELVRAREIARLAEETAKSAMSQRRQAELNAARLALQRQQKLLAVGSARAADVHRAEEKLAALAARNE